MHPLSEDDDTIASLGNLLKTPFEREEASRIAAQLLGGDFQRFTKIVYQLERDFPGEDIPIAGAAECLLYYTATGSETLNKALRDQANITQDQINLTRLIIQATRYRPLCTFEVYRGEVQWEGWEELYSHGNTFQTPSFFSASIDPMATLKGEIAITIQSRSGRIIHPFSAVHREQEVLFVPTTTFHVAGVDLTPQKAMISLVEE